MKRYSQARRRFLGLLSLVLVAIVACQSTPQTPPANSPSASPKLGAITSLLGAGATFPDFIYQRWFREFNRQNPTVQVSYQAIGSAAGIQQMLAETTDFGASDVAMTDAEIARIKRGIVMLPVTAGSVAIAYNLPGVGTGLKLPRTVYPQIFLGKITRWNDPAIAAANPGVTLPDLPIIAVFRSDGSGTTEAFTQHLSAISPQWKQQVGAGLSVQWPTGTGVKANAGVAAQIQQAEGTIGYVEYAYAKQLKMAIAALQNKAGLYITPGTQSVAAALSTVAFPENLRAFVPDPEGSGSYPISTYSWLLAYQQYPDPNKAKALRDVVRWAVTEGQKYAEDLGYVPIPADLAQRVAAAVEQIKP